MKGEPSFNLEVAADAFWLASGAEMPRCRLSQACGNMWRGEDGDEMDQPQSSAAESQSGAKDATRGGGRDKAPRTERGRRTLRKLLDAAAVEVGHRGFHAASVRGQVGRESGRARGV